MNKNLLRIFVSNQETSIIKLVLLEFFSIATFVDTQCIAQSSVMDSLGEGYFFYKDKYPNNGTPSWGLEIVYTNTFHCLEYPNQPCHCNDNENLCYDVNGCDDPVQSSHSCARETTLGKTQGIGHDANNWYISTSYSIWKIPVNVNINQDNLLQVPGVKHNTLFKVDYLASRGYNHFGDLDHFKYKGRDYLFVPILAGSAGNPSGVAVFNCSDLQFIDFCPFPSNHSSHGGWCAISQADSCLYSSNDDPGYVNQYLINWEELKNNNLNLTYFDHHLLTNVSDDTEIHHMQGGEFTPSGDLLYLNCGILGCLLGGESWATDGIHVFETSSWSEVQRSINTERNQTGCFNYSFDNIGYGVDCYLEEPQGLTIWNVDNLGAPGITGQLHVISYNHNFDVDEVSLHHFKSFKCPYDVTVFATTPNGEPATNPAISFLLNQGTTYAGCATITRSTTPSVFPCGTTPVTFTVTDNVTNDKVKCTANVNIVAKYDECLNALRIYECNKTITNNYCATASSSIPPITGYSGTIKDVWFIIYPSYSSLSVETFQVTNGLTDLVMQAFSGTCGNLTSIACDDNSGDDNHAKITLTNLPNLNPIYIRVTDYGADNSGQFGIYYNNYVGNSGADIFMGKECFAGDGSGIHQNPALTGDINGDGRTDLIFPYYDGALNVQESIVRARIADSINIGQYLYYADTIGDGSGIFQYPTLTGDMNKDGKTDLVFVYYDTQYGTIVRTKMSNTSDRFIPYADTLGDGNGVFQHPILTGDVDGDGRTDLIFLIYDQQQGTIIRTKFSNGDGTYRGVEDIPGDGNGIFQHPTLTGDVDEDGKTDLIFLIYDQHQGTIIRTKFSNGNGTYRGVEDIPGDGNGIFEHPTLTGDVDGDGKTDLIFPFDYDNNGLTIRTKFSNGDGTYRGVQDILGDGNGIFQYPVLKGDVNGDKKTDLIFVGQNWKGCGLNIRAKISRGDGTWCSDWQFMGDGDGVFQYPTLIGDISGDKKTDLIFLFDVDTIGMVIRTKVAESTYTCSNNDSISRIPISGSCIFYPNPTKGYIQLLSESSKVINLRIFNTAGNILKSFNGINNAKQLDLTSMPDGLYFIEIVDINSGEICMGKIIKN